MNNQFSTAVGGELETNLKLHNREVVKEIYGIDDDKYDELIAILRSGDGELPEMTPSITLPLTPEEQAVLNVPEPEPVEEIEIKPNVGYKGKPVGDQLLVQRVEREHSSNLIIPPSAKSKSDVGYVKEVGIEVTRAKVGQLVLFDKFASIGADISLIDESGLERQFLLLKDIDVMMQLEKVTLDG